jgi:hypothetical protein
MVVNRYEILKALGDDFENLVILDIISAKMLKWLECYEAYLKCKETSPDKKINMQRLAEDYNIGLRTFYNIITFMESG